MFQTDAGRTDCTRPSSAAAWPLVIEWQRLPRKVFRRSIAWLSDSLSTLRSADYSNATQDSLPVAGQALLDGIPTRKVPMKGFKVVIYISFPFPKLLGAIDADEDARWVLHRWRHDFNSVLLPFTQAGTWNGGRPRRSMMRSGINQAGTPKRCTSHSVLFVLCPKSSDSDSVRPLSDPEQQTGGPGGEGTHWYQSDILNGVL